MQAVRVRRSSLLQRRKNAGRKSFYGTTPGEQSPSARSSLGGSVGSTGTRNKGLFAEIERSDVFQVCTLVVIMVNAGWVCVDVQWNHVSMKKDDGRLPLEPASIIVDNFFCGYFLFEMIIRFLAFSKLRFCIKDTLFLFDALLTWVMVVETWLLPTVVSAVGGGAGVSGVLSNFSSLRLLRAARMTRVLRTMQFFPEVVTLLKGMFRAAKPVLLISLFLMVLTYMFATAMTGHLGRPNYQPPPPQKGVLHAPLLFAHVSRSMLSLFTAGVLGDNLAKTVRALRVESLMCMFLFFTFVVVSGMALLNMLVAVLCRIMEDTSGDSAQGKLEASLLGELLALDTPQDGLLHEAEWRQLRGQPGTLAALTGLGVAPCDLQERLGQCQEALFGERGSRAARTGGGEGAWRSTREGTGLAIGDFLDALDTLRWDIPASTLDTYSLQAMVQCEDQLLQRSLESVEASLGRLLLDGGPSQSTRTLAGEGTAEQTSLSSSSGCMGKLTSAVPNSELSTASGCEGDSWLHGVPTEILFFALKGRRASALAELKGFLSR